MAKGESLQQTHAPGAASAQHPPSPNKPDEVLHLWTGDTDHQDDVPGDSKTRLVSDSDNVVVNITGS